MISLMMSDPSRTTRGSSGSSARGRREFPCRRCLAADGHARRARRRTPTASRCIESSRTFIIRSTVFSISESIPIRSPAVAAARQEGVSPTRGPPRIATATYGESSAVPDEKNERADVLPADCVLREHDRRDRNRPDRLILLLLFG
jgi:hypothetical protein